MRNVLPSVLCIAAIATSARALPPARTPLQTLSITANTGEKPQSKVWTHAGKWWCVLPNSSGTWVWRLDGNTWTSSLKLSNVTTTKADVKAAGAVTHVLLYEGASSQLASIEYVPAIQSYQFWTARPDNVPITLDNGVETATIDVDSQGRMWLASDEVDEIMVRYSDPPYSTWSGPISLVTGIDGDDISVVAALPGGSIGVLWSNQNTRRFGFRSHVDGTDSTSWTTDEVPASQSALPLGLGMSDDHLNLAVASDGTLYAAVKTSYDTSGSTKIALLVRRPSGNWDNLYEVDQSGTRGIALLNEGTATITVVYTSAEGSGSIVYKESSTTSIAFGPTHNTLISGSLNDASSTKQNIDGAMVILASTTSDPRSAVGVFMTSCTAVTCNAPPLCHTATGATCDTGTGVCTYPSVADAASCADADACNGAETCQAGICTVGTAVTCTDDGNVCDGPETCNPSTGTCESGPAVTCNDGNICTDDSCVPMTGCTHTSNTASCSDGLYCNGLEECGDGFCRSGVTVTCDDGVPCTADSCNESTQSCNYAPCTVVVSAGGARHLVVTPPAGVASVALKVSSAGLDCLPKYVDAAGRLVALPVFQSSAQWGTVHVGDRPIVPATAYTVTAELVGGEAVGSGSAATGGWGNADGQGDVSVFDIICVMDGSQDIFTHCNLDSDDQKVGVPDGLIDLDDILATLDSFSGVAYPDVDPCMAYGPNTRSGANRH